MVSKLMFGLYLHIPFCVHRCSYCDFYSSTQYRAEDFAALADKLVWEAGEAAAWLKAQGHSQPVTSIFLGGGTPSLMPLPDLQRVFEGLKKSFSWQEDAEITLEANPETVTEAFAAGLREQTPVNRVSLGAQSFQARHLQTLERLGSAESIQQAVKRLRAVGFENYSLDLIFGIPGQTPQELVADIESVVALQPKHTSFYSLTLKPGHKLYGGLPSDDTAADLYELGRGRLAELGYEAYEISNFCQPGFESRHNQLYWQGGDFLGLGPSAASRFFWNGRSHHRKQIAHWETYLKTASFPSPEFEAITPNQTVLESVFLELRNRAGIPLEAFHTRYGYDLAQAQQLPFFEKQGLLERTPTHLRLTSKGWLLAEGIAQRLVDLPVGQSA
ncbi:radical SAM family heme chaperone HemW [bacterium]|nr:radical SAM family heme chaperone HemW [bacterium]